MSLTVILNPSVAISHPLDCLAMDTVNRVDRTAKTAGDKELNVTKSWSVMATGFSGGKLGDFIIHQLQEQGISNQFSKSKGKREIVLLFYMKACRQKFWKLVPTVMWTKPKSL